MNSYRYALACIVALVPGHALADYPERPISYLVGFSAGGGTDVGVRTWAPYLEKCLGQPITVLNKPGAGGALAFAELATSKPDGYTLGALNLPNMPLSYITLPSTSYTIDSFTFLAATYQSKVSIITKPGSRFKTLQDVMEAAKTETIAMGVGSIGSDDHLILLRLMKAAGVTFTYIPLGDTAMTRNGVIGGHVEIAGLSVTDAVPYKDDLDVLAVASAERVESFPDVPTFRELGYDVVGGSRHIVGAPAGLPADVTAKLDGCLKSVLADPAYQADAKTRGFFLEALDAAATTDWVKQEAGALEELWKSDPWQ